MAQTPEVELLTLLDMRYIASPAVPKNAGETVGRPTQRSFAAGEGLI